jgi:very-short-patch-repair endonuclease
MPQTWKSSRKDWAKYRKYARENRAEMSFPEVVLWQNIRGRQINGIKFRRQHVIGIFEVDFYSHDLGLILEVDGWSHDFQVVHDDEREEFLLAHGLIIHHIQVDQILHHLPDVIIELEQLTEDLLSKRNLTPDKT